jgi:hypothetical protein
MSERHPPRWGRWGRVAYLIRGARQRLFALFAPKPPLSPSARPCAGLGAPGPTADDLGHSAGEAGQLAAVCLGRPVYSGKGRPRLWCTVCRPPLPDRHHRLLVVRSPRCVDCGVDLPLMTGPGQLRRRCAPCQAARKRERDGLYRRQRREQSERAVNACSMGYNGE